MSVSRLERSDTGRSSRQSARSFRTVVENPDFVQKGIDAWHFNWRPKYWENLINLDEAEETLLNVYDQIEMESEANKLEMVEDSIKEDLVEAEMWVSLTILSSVNLVNWLIISFVQVRNHEVDLRRAKASNLESLALNRLKIQLVALNLRKLKVSSILINIDNCNKSIFCARCYPRWRDWRERRNSWNQYAGRRRKGATRQHIMLLNNQIIIVGASLITSPANRVSNCRD